MTTNEIWITIMIIAWWYSNKFLSLPIILFPFYSILFTCLPVSPYGDYLPASDSVSFIPFYLLAFLCLHAVIICLPDMDCMRFWSCQVDVDNPNVLVVEKRRDCLPVSPCGDYLPAGDSVSFILFYLLVFQCLQVIICLSDMDRMSVLVLPSRYWQSVCFSFKDRN